MTAISRRQFAGGAMGLAAAAALAACAPLSSGGRRGTGLTAIVVGAGVAGLTAARDLQAAGATVIVLEARDRIGGRTVTEVREGFPLDLGASWIHGVDGNPVASLAAEAGLETVPTDVENAVGFDAATADGLLDDAALARAAARLDEAVQRGYDAEVDQPLQVIVDTAASGAPADQARLVRYLAASAIENEYAGPLSELSAYWFDEAEAYGGGDAMIDGGYGQVPAVLAERLDVRMSSPVTAIAVGGDRVTVTTASDSANAGSFDADAVIVTVPLGVLRQGAVAFDPPLPAEHRAAIAGLGMGSLNKVFLHFDSVFWDDDVDWIGIVPPADVDPWVDWVTIGRAADAPVLLGFAAGDLGRWVDAQPDEAVVASALTALRMAYPGAPEPLEAFVTRWGADPYAGGSYSFAAVGSDPAMRDTLAEPVGDRLVLAGEATSREHPSTVHGALLSGQRAAAAVLDALGA